MIDVRAVAVSAVVVDSVVAIGGLIVTGEVEIVDLMLNLKELLNVH